MTQVKKISIRDAMDYIVHAKLLLPAIQREFVWKRQAIEIMFDSILRGYPINSFMFWRINNVYYQNLDFYRFLDPKYVYGVSKNPDYTKVTPSNNESLNEQLIVIDGQQRLTGIFIGLYGSYSTEKGKPMYLCLRLDDRATSDGKEYDFLFLTDSQLKKQQSGQVWIKMNDLTTPNYNPLMLLSAYPQLINNAFATETIKHLITLLDSDDYLHYYDISGYNSIDDVLEIFTRTNNSGTPLSKGDLLLSVMTSKWTGLGGNAREYVKDIIEEVKGLGYSIDRDWVIKCILVLYGSSVKMKVASISSPLANGQTVTEIIFSEKDRFKDAVIASFILISSFGLIEKGLSTKLAVIPIVHFLCKHNLSSTVNKSINGQSFSSTKGRDYRHDIKKWLFRAIALNLFDAGTDDILAKLKGIVDNYSSNSYFPYAEIENQFMHVLSDSRIDLDRLLNTRKVSAFPILNIIFSSRALKPTGKYDMDHTHPAVQFSNLSNVTFTSSQDEQLAKDGFTFDTVRNLQLLKSGDNKSKNKMELQAWINSSNNPIALKDYHFIPKNVSLDIADFGSYIDKRSRLLKKELKKNLEVV